MRVLLVISGWVEFDEDGRDKAILELLQKPAKDFDAMTVLDEPDAEEFLKNAIMK